jgi:hypothetical protein
MATTGYKNGDAIAGWVLKEHLGAGGNGEVWRAEREVGQQAAIKLLKTKDASSERFKRFVAEIAVLRRLGDRSGILPIIDAMIPAAPSRQVPAWLVTPLAAGIREALGSRPSLNVVVAAVADIATTLAGLHAEAVFHRDVKPDNLFCLDGRWVIGDFGLVSYPDKAAITLDGRKLGPANFLPPELVSQPSKAAGGPADVYMLAKTLWVLSVGQTFPLPGPQRADDRTTQIGTFFSESRAHQLDRLLERATRNDPSRRPTMADLAAELTAWLTPQVSTTESGADVSATQARLNDLDQRYAMAEELSAQNTVDSLVTPGFKLLDPVASQLRALSLGVATAGGKALSAEFRTGVLPIAAARATYAESGVAAISFFRKQPVMHSGFLFQMDQSKPDAVRVTVAHVIAAGDCTCVWHEQRVVPSGSATADHALATLAERLAATAATAVDQLATVLELKVMTVSADRPPTA